MRPSRFTRALGTLVLVGLPTAPAVAQSALDAPANVANAWVAAPGTIQFNLLHRFSVGPAPSRKLINSPTIGISSGLVDWLNIGFNYATNSEVVRNYPNEWEFFGRAAALRQDDGAPVDAFVQGGYNVASRSTDGAATIGRELGRARLVATGEVLHHAFDAAETRYAAGGGLSFRLSPLIAVSADGVSLVDRHAGERAAWSAGIQFGVPETPHTLSLHATNVNSRTLEGIAKGTSSTRYGFEYTIPITLRRYVHGAKRPVVADHPAPVDSMQRVSPPMSRDSMMRKTPPGGPSADEATVEPMFASGDTVVVDIKAFMFGRKQKIEIKPGSVVVWRNRDPLTHVVVADDKSFESLQIPSGSSWSRRFDDVGTVVYHCVPHPFMSGTIVVK